MKNTVLLIEDEPDFQKLVKAILKKDGYGVLVAESGEDGLRMVEKDKPRLVILDLNLPGMDGFEVLRRLRASTETKRLPVLILTVRSREPDVVEGLDLGADDYLVKSFSPKEFLARIERLFSRTKKSVGRAAMALLLGLMLGGAAAGPVAADEQADVARWMTAELTSLLDQFLGPNKAKVVVSVKGRISQTESRTELISGAGGEGEESEGGWLWERTAERRPLLPGYKSQKDVRRDSGPRERKIRRAVTVPGFVVEQLRISVVLDQSIPTETVDELRRMLKSVADIDPSRGDLLEVFQLPVTPAWQRLIGSEGFLRGAMYLGGVLAAFFVAGLIGYGLLSRFARRLVEGIAMARRTPSRAHDAIQLDVARKAEQLEGGEQGLLPEPGLLAEPGTIIPGETVEGAEGASAWELLKEKDKEDLAAVFGEEPPEQLALLLGFLSRQSPGLSSRIFAALPRSRQLEVSNAMAGLTRSDPDEIAELEARLRERIEQATKGSEQLGRMLSWLDPEHREWVLNEFRERHPETAEEVERSLFTFDQLGDAPTGALRRLLTSKPYELWGMALRGMPEEFIGKIFELMPKDIAAAMREIIDSPQLKEKVLQARAEILETALELGRKGDIALKAGEISAERL